MMPSSTSPTTLAPGALPTRLCSAAVLLLFTCLLAVDHVAATLGLLLGLTGLYLVGRRPALSASEREFLLLMALLPLSYLINMLLTLSWDLHILNRPMRLFYGFLMCIALARLGFSRAMLFWGCVLGAFAAAGTALAQIAWQGLARAEGITNAVPFGNYSLLLGTVALAGGLSRLDGKGGGRGLALLGLAACVAGIGASVASGSRGGWLALPLLLMLVAWAYRVRLGRRRLMVGAAAGLVALAVLASLPTVQQRVEQGIAEVSQLASGDKSDETLRSSTALRLQMWAWGLKRFTEQPLTGIGYANFSRVRRVAVENHELPQDFIGFANLHSEPINALAVAGVPGGLFLLAFWLLSVRFFLRRLRRGADHPEVRFHAVAGLLVLLGSAVFSLTESLVGTTLASIALAVFLATPAAALIRLEREGALPATDPRR